MNYLHSISFHYEHPDNQLLVRGLPPSHLAVRVNDQLNIFGNVLDLPTLAVERNGTKGQGLQDRYDVGLGSASDTNTQIRNT